ncbi:schwannomin-interacting protein 1 [Eurytemora carolleeae]|uniref:schwannomin-interacting protein 1 n=1 Tax=Eurytemora carolleeae TaxID=1294199 RepID=UPI000C79230C|nr:schwannomin-interacting protein 1 [Eurytemora carolleeae]|eukprot:XP_023335499.1 schwannomin-interacting protein 1-like [Eurytemora affinis]
MPVFDGLLNKLQEVSLSDLNHELGKAKESLVYESSNYLQTIREDAVHVGGLIRSESTRFGDYFGRKKPGIKKSTSLPVIQAQHAPGTQVLGDKYRYKSTVNQEEVIVSPTDLVDQDSVVSRFIKVVGSQSPDQIAPRAQSRLKPNTREDIRRKLANFGEPDDDDIQAEDNNLEICFINETASDEIEEGVCLNPLAEESEEEADEDEDDDLDDSEYLEDSRVFPRSKSEWEAFRSPEHSTLSVSECSKPDPRSRAERLKSREEKRKRKCQRAARLALAQCAQVARRQLLVEKEQRLETTRLKKIIGLNHSQLNQTNLHQFNISTLQVILNDVRESIELNNAELVQLLIKKDDLQSEQESMLIDIEDISQRR